MTPETPVQPSLESLLAGYLRRQAEAAELGLAAADVGEVLPYEAGPAPTIEPRLAWEAGIAAAPHLGAPLGIKPPPGWSNLVAQTPPQVAIAFCVGNYPQLVRDFHKLLAADRPSSLTPAPLEPIRVEPLFDWAEKTESFPAALVALAAFRLARQFDRADAMARRPVPAEWKAAWDNEQAALLWHRGDRDEALDRWSKLPASLPVRFNRAMAQLFLSRGNADARIELEAVMDELPETSPWRHLARLYHTLGILWAE